MGIWYSRVRKIFKYARKHCYTLYLLTTSRKVIHLKDQLFGSGVYSSGLQSSNFLVWSFFSTWSGVTFYTDKSLPFVNIKSRRNFGWLLESPEITSIYYEWIKLNYQKFEMIFTHQRYLLELNNKFQFAPAGGCWIKKRDQKIYPKSKMVSFITSGKSSTTGHRLRLSIIKEDLPGVNKFGRDIRPVKNKLEALMNYRYAIVVENNKSDFYFTEKLIDCFRTGTVPIYWGCPSIGKFFDVNGMIIFNEIQELKAILTGLSENDFSERQAAIQKNFDLAQEYILSEDYIFKNYPDIFS